MIDGVITKHVRSRRRFPWLTSKKLTQATVTADGALTPFKRALLWVTALSSRSFHSRGGHDGVQHRDGDPALVRGLQLDR
jgi:hypothetical protein